MVTPGSNDKIGPVEDKPPVQDKEIGHDQTELDAAQEHKETDKGHKETPLPGRNDQTHFPKCPPTKGSGNNLHDGQECYDLLGNFSVTYNGLSLGVLPPTLTQLSWSEVRE